MILLYWNRFLSFNIINMANDVAVLFLKDSKRWKKNEIKNVNVHFFNNSLKPTWIAKVADAQTLNIAKQHEEKKQKDHGKKIQEIENLYQELKQNPLIFKKQTTAMNHLYDSIDHKEIINEILMKYKIKLDKNIIILAEKIQNTWEYEVWFEFETIKGKFKIIVEKK